MELARPARAGADLCPVRGRLRVDHGRIAREAFSAVRAFGHTHQWLLGDLLASRRLEVIRPEDRLPSALLNRLIAPKRVGIARMRLLDLPVEEVFWW